MPTFDIATVLRIVARGVAILLIVSLTVRAVLALTAKLSDLFAAIRMNEIPTFIGFAEGLSLLPNNASACVSIIVVAYVSRYIFNWTMRLASWLKEIGK